MDPNPVSDQHDAAPVWTAPMMRPAVRPAFPLGPLGVWVRDAFMDVARREAATVEPLTWWHP